MMNKTADVLQYAVVLDLWPAAAVITHHNVFVNKCVTKMGQLYRVVRKSDTPVLILR